MKRLISILLTVCMVAGVSIPAHAGDMITDEVPSEVETSTVKVISTLAELQAAIETAESGDTIALGQTIYINGEIVSTDREITLIRADGFTSGNMVVIYSGVLDGFRFMESAAAGAINIRPTQDSVVTVKNCILDGGGVGEGISITGTSDQHQVTISSCEFSDNYHHSVDVRTDKNVNIEDCYIHDNYYDLGASGAVQSSGNLKLIRCTVTANTSWANAGLMCSGGTLVVDDCQIKDNIILSPDSGIAVDIFCLDTVWSLSDSQNTLGAGYYDLTTGEKLAIPVIESSESAKLIFLTDEDAEDHFAPPTSTDEGITQPGDGDDHPQPEEPNPPTTGTDNDGDTSDNDQSGTEQPEKPVEDNSNNGDDYTPSRPHKPVQRPSEPDTDTQKPDEGTPAPTLACGNATIDVSRSVVLAGYEDGALHEEDPLTRAQIAAIIFRLLTDETIEQYDGNAPVFEDVPTDAWYYRYVSTIARAGIVAGTGNGYYTPDGLVTWAQAVTILTRFVEAQEYTLTEIRYSGWALQAVQTAAALGWIEDTATFDPDSVISRGELVSLVNGVLENYR